MKAELAVLVTRIARNVVRLRRRKKMTQTELARRAGISLTTLNEIEGLRHGDIRLSTISALARALGVPVTGLL